MDTEDWLQRWRQGRTGFHREQVMPLLEQHWSSLSLPTDERVLVPLAGKSLDMLWLAAQGYRVLGVELSPLAVAQFFAENDLQIRAHNEQAKAGRVELICGDVFDLARATVASCHGIYDRAALIALPPALRKRYAAELYSALPVGCLGLLITLEYPQAEMEGPPYSVPEHEVRSLFEADWAVDLLERRDILDDQPRFAEQGVTAMTTAVYRLQRRPAHT